MEGVVALSEQYLLFISSQISPPAALCSSADKNTK